MDAAGPGSQGPVTAPSPSGASPSVKLRAVEKRFGAVAAVRGASFAARAGEITALVGENGAGKTTLMRILAGRLPADAGEILVDGIPVILRSPSDALALGITMVEQDTRLVGALSVFENIILGAEPAGAGFLSGRAASRATAILESLSSRADHRDRASSLDAPERQRVAVARALFRGARVIILDEPTSLVGPFERASLFATMRRLAASGVAVIFVSHKLGEVFEVSHEVTVLRAGRTVLSARAGDITPAGVVAAMVGESPAIPAKHAAVAGGPVMRFDGARTAGAGRDRLNGASLQVRTGEVVGVAGVSGNGQRALADAASGILKPTGGTVALPSSGRTAVVGEFVDETDLVRPMRVWENAVLGREGEYSRVLGMDRAGATETLRRLGGEFSFAADPDAPVSALSGGNRQRLVLARELDGGPALVVAIEPTRGLDVAAAALARNALRSAAARGAGVLVISYDLDELYAIADRIVVISSGVIRAPSCQPPDRSELARLMTA